MEKAKCHLQEIHFKYNNIERLKVNGYCANTNPKKAGLALLILEKEDFRVKNIARNQQVYCIMMKGGIASKTCRHFTKEHQNS